MNQLLSLISGALIAYMNFLNAKLGLAYGNYISIVIIHLIGLICLIPLCINKIKFVKGIPLWYYLGGGIGMLTVVLCNISIPVLGVTIQMAICLLGQTVSSLIVDHFGLFGFNKYPINKNKLISLGLIIIGTAVMIIW